MRNNYADLNTIIFRKKWHKVFLKLSDAEAGALIKALYSHIIGGSARQYLKSVNAEHLRKPAGAIISDLEATAKNYNKVKAARANRGTRAPYSDAYKPQRTRKYNF